MQCQDRLLSARVNDAALASVSHTSHIETARLQGGGRCDDAMFSIKAHTRHGPIHICAAIPPAPRGRRQP